VLEQVTARVITTYRPPKWHQIDSAHSGASENGTPSLDITITPPFPMRQNGDYRLSLSLLVDSDANWNNNNNNNIQIIVVDNGAFE
jgi:hypothetical protein